MANRWICRLICCELTLAAFTWSVAPAVADEPARLRILTSPAPVPATATAQEETIVEVEELPVDAPPERLPDSQSWAMKPIGDVTLNIATPPGELPENVAPPYMASAGQYTDQSNLEASGWSYGYYWQASAFCHGPLYFEEVNLERYGYSCGILQPAVSAAHFFGTLPVLPYKMAVNPPGTCIYTLGQPRPGSNTPFQLHRPPLRLDAACVQGAVVTGLIFLVP